MKIQNQPPKLTQPQQVQPQDASAQAPAADPAARLPVDESARQYTWYDTPAEASQAIPKENLKHPDGRKLVTAECVDGQTRYRPYDVYRDELKGAGTKLTLAAATTGATAAAGFAMASSASSIPLALMGAATLALTGVSAVGLVGALAYVGIRALTAPPPR